MTGQLYFRIGQDWVDAGSRFGLTLGHGSLDALLAPPTLKPFVSNKSRLEHGTRYVVTNARYEERTITIPFHIIAANYEALKAKYDDLLSVLLGGSVTLKTPLVPNTVYKLIFVSLTQFGHIGGTSLFNVKFTEPNPNDRSL